MKLDEVLDNNVCYERTYYWLRKQKNWKRKVLDKGRTQAVLKLVVSDMPEYAVTSIVVHPSKLAEWVWHRTRYKIAMDNNGEICDVTMEYQPSYVSEDAENKE